MLEFFFLFLSWLVWRNNKQTKKIVNFVSDSHIVCEQMLHINFQCISCSMHHLSIGTLALHRKMNVFLLLLLSWFERSMCWSVWTRVVALCLPIGFEYRNYNLRRRIKSIAAYLGFDCCTPRLPAPHEHHCHWGVFPLSMSHTEHKYLNEIQKTYAERQLHHSRLYHSRPISLSGWHGKVTF